MDVDLPELRSTVDACEKEFSESSKSISTIKEEDYPDAEAYIADFYERIHGFIDRTNDLITAYRDYIAVLENACTEQEK
ncbi:MAG: hypothetical protein U9N07_06475 [Euryarchaeota archaeon]|nr:hypothetical protein [Euryarchaeota archaeon]